MAGPRHGGTSWTVRRRWRRRAGTERAPGPAPVPDASRDHATRDRCRAPGRGQVDRLAGARGYSRIEDDRAHLRAFRDVARVRRGGRGHPEELTVVTGGEEHRGRPGPALSVDGGKGQVGDTVDDRPAGGNKVSVCHGRVSYCQRRGSHTHMRPVTIITGGTKGIGAATAVRLAHAGHDLALTYHEDDAAAEQAATAVRDAGARCVLVKADVATEEDVAHLFATAAGQLGAVTGLVNNAGATIHI